MKVLAIIKYEDGVNYINDDDFYTYTDDKPYVFMLFLDKTLGNLQHTVVEKYNIK